MTPQDAAAVEAILSRRGIATESLSGLSPWAMPSGGRVDLIRSVIAEEDPALAQRHAQTYLPAPSMQYLALQARLQAGADVALSDLPAALQEEFRLREPLVVAQAREAWEQQQLQALEAGAAAAAERNQQTRGPSEIEQLMLEDSRQRMREDLRANGRRLGVMP